LPKLKMMAPEFYDTLKFHPSWTRLLLQFIFDKRYTLFSRIERSKGSGAMSAPSNRVAMPSPDGLYPEPKAVNIS